MSDEALGRLLDLPWWKRIWTVQEAILPKQAYVMCGTIPLPLFAVLAAHSHFAEHTCCADILNLNTFHTTLRAIDVVRQSPRTADSLTFALHIFQSRQAGDQRDKIFGLMAICGNVDMFHADYTFH